MLSIDWIVLCDGTSRLSSADRNSPFLALGFGLVSRAGYYKFTFIFTLEYLHVCGNFRNILNRNRIKVCFNNWDS